MRYHALAADYDGTLASRGRLDGATAAALRRLQASGRKLILVTGRQIEDLVRVCAEIDLFDLIVAENGAVIRDPVTRVERPLAEPPPPAFLGALRARKIDPLSVGRVIVATLTPFEPRVRDAMSTCGLSRQLIFNKGALMILPDGIDKGSGVRAGLAELGILPENAVAVGDAENDGPFLAACGCGVAVANALPALKQQADLVTAGSCGAGVSELVEALVTDDLAGVPVARRPGREILRFGP